MIVKLSKFLFNHHQKCCSKSINILMPLPVVVIKSSIISISLRDFSNHTSRSLSTLTCSTISSSNSRLKAQPFLSISGQSQLQEQQCRRASSTTKEEIEKTHEQIKKEARLHEIQQKKSKINPPKIILIDETDKINVMILDDAVRLAKKRGFEIRQIDNTEARMKTDKAIFKLFSSKDLDSLAVEDKEWKAKEIETKSIRKEGKYRPEKTVMIKSTSSEHDALSKLSKIKPWIEKYHKVRVLIQQSNTGDMKKLLKLAENTVKECEGSIEQKVINTSQIRFVIKPNKLPKSSSADSDDDDNDSEENAQQDDNKAEIKPKANPNPK